MQLFFQGGDVSDHRKRLQEQGVKHIALSFRQLEKRIKKTAVWSIADHFDDDTVILLDSGAYSAKTDDDWTEDDWRAYVDRYCIFVENNIDRVDMVTEFDGVSLGRDFIEEMREGYWDTLGASDKFMPVWHEEHGGLAELERLATEYDRVAITNTSLDDRRVMANRLNSLVQKYNLALHGLAITKPDDVLAVKFASVSSTSWVSPMRYGDTIVWDGHRLRRYPTKYKDQARKRHRRLFEKAGFDADKIAADDPKEVVALSIWSWLQFEQAVNRRKGLQAVPDAPEEPEEAQIASIWDDEAPEPNTETEAPQPAIGPKKSGTLPALTPDEMPTLPVLNFDRVSTTDSEGNPGDPALVARSTKVSIRQCDTCYVASTCPAMEPGSSCKFSIPVEIRTKEQLMGAMQSVAEMQMQRVAFARFAEELEGGYPDQSVSSEIDRFFGVIGKMREINDNRDFLRIQVEQRGEAGVLSRLFGANNVERTQGDIDPAKADEMLGDMIDAEVIEDD